VTGYTFNACNKNAFALDYTGKTFATPTEPGAPHVPPERDDPAGRLVVAAHAHESQA